MPRVGVACGGLSRRLNLLRGGLLGLSLCNCRLLGLSINILLGRNIFGRIIFCRRLRGGIYLLGSLAVDRVIYGGIIFGGGLLCRHIFPLGRSPHRGSALLAEFTSLI